MDRENEILAALLGLREDLRDLRQVMGQGQALGFGKLEQPLYIFLNHDWWKTDAKPYVLYTKREGESRHPIFERDLTGYIRNLYRREQTQEKTGQNKPVLDIEIFAGRTYILQTAFYSNVSISLLSALAELEDLNEPLTLLFETSQGKRSHPTIFCRVITGGKRLNPKFDKSTDIKSIYEKLVQHFNFGPWQERLDAEQ